MCCWRGWRCTAASASAPSSAESALALQPSLAEARYQLGRLALAADNAPAAARHLEAAAGNGLDDSHALLDGARAAASGQDGGVRAAHGAFPPAQTVGGIAGHMKWAAFAMLFASAASAPLFRDVTAGSGITWRHFNGQSPDRFLLESTAGGVAALDFDNDGKLDLLFVNGGETPHGKSRTPVRHALYRNLGGGRFADVTARAGLGSTRFSAWAWPPPTRQRRLHGYLHHRLSFGRAVS